MELTEHQQAARDSVHDLVKDSVESLRRIRYADIDSLEKDKLVREVTANLHHIDTLRRNC